MFKSRLLDGAYIFCASGVQQSKCLHMSHPYDTFIQTVILGARVAPLGAWGDPTCHGVLATDLSSLF